MRTGISITMTPSDRSRLEEIGRDRNAPQKHVWRAAIVLLTYMTWPFALWKTLSLKINT